MQTVFLGRVTPAQPIVIDADNATQYTPVIDTWLTTALWEIWL
jgi:hypothetical protein